MKLNSKKRMMFFIIIFSGIFFYSDNSAAHILEVYAAGQQMQGDKTSFNGKELKVMDNVLGGAGAGFNLENYNLNIVLLFGSTKIKIEDKVLKSELFGFEANFEYSFLMRNFSPFIGAGIGSINYTDSFVAFENLNETDASYNVSGGIKWVLNENYFLKALYKATWTKIKHTDSSIMFHGISINFGYVF
jgi:hypothetical protein